MEQEAVWKFSGGLADRIVGGNNNIRLIASTASPQSTGISILSEGGVENSIGPLPVSESAAAGRCVCRPRRDGRNLGFPETGRLTPGFCPTSRDNREERRLKAGGRLKAWPHIPPASTLVRATWFGSTQGEID